MDLMTAPEAAKMLRRHPATIARWILKGKLRAHRLNGRFLIARADVLAMLQPVERVKHADTAEQRSRRDEWNNAVLHKYGVKT